MGAMSRNVNTIIVCEDSQHEAFARRFLERIGIDLRVQRVEKSPKGRGSGEQFVRERFATELAYYRSRQHRVEQALIVIIDADTRGFRETIARVEETAQANGQRLRGPGERVAVFVAARNIETWLAYLDGETVDETSNYPRLARPRDCGNHVDRLYDMCQQGELREPAPTSLQAACVEYRTRILPA
jgi:hypothetical protein